MFDYLVVKQGAVFDRVAALKEELAIAQIAEMVRRNPGLFTQGLDPLSAAALKLDEVVRQHASRD
jgi:hypothetical protein